MTAPAHIGGLPVEEAIVQAAPAALAAVMALRLAAGRVRRWVTRR